jgi:hypothetical protein
VDQKFSELGIMRREHPAYSPNLAACELGLFEYLKAHMEGGTFTDEMNVQIEANKILLSIEPDLFMWVFAARR